MFIIKGDTFANVYDIILQKLIKDPDYVTSPRGDQIHECMDTMFKIENPKSCLIVNPVRPTNMKYLKAELDLYFQGVNKLDEFVKASKFWKDIGNSDGTVNSAYGFLIFKEVNEWGYNQWEWAYNSLMRDTDTRQAFMHFNKPNHQFQSNKDQVCTLNYLFNVRDNKLNASVIMRSSDVFFGLIYDIPYFTLLQQCMLLLLKQNKKYENLELGTYTHHSISQHLYSRNIDVLTESLKKQTQTLSLPEIKFSPVDEYGIFTGYGNDKFGNWMTNE